MAEQGINSNDQGAQSAEQGRTKDRKRAAARIRVMGICPIRAIRVLSFLAGLLVATLAHSQPRVSPAAPLASPPQTEAPADVDAEVAQQHSALSEEVPHLVVDHARGQQKWIARTQAALNESGLTIDRPQLLVVVDRNPRVQQMRLIVAQPQGQWYDLGGTKVSTGQVGRFDYFLTPTGVFLHTDAILDWRAEGTFNAHHVRGLGESGMRVCDFGWQRAVRGWRSATKVSKMRLLLHATDPDTLARRLGRAASKGCIRIPEAMDLFLDRHGILDTDYEQAAQHNPRFQAVLLPDRRRCPGRDRLFGAALMPRQRFSMLHRKGSGASSTPAGFSRNARLPTSCPVGI
jgi:hypothetical protein